ncbi:MAG: hypothetical protein ACXW4M_11175 [Anaerolineales bacterium]
MESSFREEGSGAQQDPKRFFVSLPILPSIIKWLASLIKLTEEEREDAGIYLGRLGGE